MNLFCEENEKNKPFIRATGKGNMFDSYSVCACLNGCGGGPPSNGTCDQTDSCSSKTPNNDEMISLHDLDNPYAALTAEDNLSFTYYYNPCSGIKLDILEKCNGVAAC